MACYHPRMLRTLAFLVALAGAQLPGSDATAQVSPQSIAADVKRVANTYLTKENRNVAAIVRKAGKSASEDPDLAGLSSQQLPVVRQFLGRLAAEKNLEQLKTQLKQMEEQSAKADPKNQQFMNILKKKTAERIAELEKK